MSSLKTFLKLYKMCKIVLGSSLNIFCIEMFSNRIKMLYFPSFGEKNFIERRRKREREKERERKRERGREREKERERKVERSKYRERVGSINEEYLQ